MRYSIFKTRWGWFGLLADERGLLRSCLPQADRDAVKAMLLEGVDSCAHSKESFADCQASVRAYFEGRRADFSRVPVNVEMFGAFAQTVLNTLHRLPYGKTQTYTELAAAAGRRRAVRAAANAVAANPLPLIIPCHRIVRKDGSLGGFSAPGGIRTKARLLALEHGLPEAQ